MKYTNKEKMLYRNLLIKSIDGQISDDEMQQLNRLLTSYPDLYKYHVQCMQLELALQDYRGLASHELKGVPLLNDLFWEQMAEYEKTAPIVEMHQAEPPRELIQKVVYPPREKYAMSKFNYFVLAASAAAVLFIVLFVKLTPHRSSVEVATIVDQMNVQWANPATSLKNNDSVFTNESFFLSKGLVTIQTNRGVSLTFEGPTEFGFSKEGDLSMNYGKVYAKVSSQGIGFTVFTSNSKIIDLGTEFGVAVNHDNTTELYVLKGKTTLVSGSSWLDKKTQTVQQQQARKISADGAQIKEIPMREEAFVRSINSKTNVVWRGFRADFALFDNMDGHAHGNVTNMTPNGDLGGQWDSLTETPQGGRVEMVSEDGNQFLNITSHSSGAGRGSAFNGLNCAINNGQKGVLFFRFNVTSTRDDPVGMYMGLHTQTDERILGVSNRVNLIAAGFAAFKDTNNPTAPYDITTIDRRRVLKSDLKRDTWYNAWIVADNGADTFDLYISQAASPVGKPDMPTEEDMVGCDLPFEHSTTDPLVGGIFWASQQPAGLSTQQTPWVSIDEIWWGLCPAL